MFETTRIKRGEEKRKEKSKKKIPRFHARKESALPRKAVLREARTTADRQHPGQTSKQTRVQMIKSQRGQAKTQRIWSRAL